MSTSCGTIDMFLRQYHPGRWRVIMIIDPNAIAKALGLPVPPPRNRRRERRQNAPRRPSS